jgi:CO/xanthine dehydrogenase FAD-binding subunit
MIEGFHTPTTIDDALALARSFGDRALFLGGGVELNSAEGRRSPEHLISLAGLGLDGVQASDDEVVIGACCTYQQLIDGDGVPEALKTAAAEV